MGFGYERNYTCKYSPRHLGRSNRSWKRLKIPDRVAEGRSKGPIESPQLKETPNYQSGASAISENDLT
jgi:hypothetical protein